MTTFQNIDTIQQNVIGKEQLKDEMFAELVGHRRDKNMTAQESIEACHEYKRLFPQPAIFGLSNDRGFTDSVLMPTHYDFNEAQLDAIEESREKWSVVEVLDSEVVTRRIESGNRITLGDAMSMILQERINSYKGLEEDKDSMVRGNGVVQDSMYCALTKKTLYFVK